MRKLFLIIMIGIIFVSFFNAEVFADKEGKNSKAESVENEKAETKDAAGDVEEESAKEEAEVKTQEDKRTWWEKRADTDANGRVSSKEKRAWMVCADHARLHKTLEKHSQESRDTE